MARGKFFWGFLLVLLALSILAVMMAGVAAYWLT
jgi:hypothetical protein